MNGVRLSVLLLVGVLLVGCDQLGLASQDRYRLGPARDVVLASIESAGGLKAWKNVGRIHANAVLTVYDDQGQAYVDRLKQVINVNGGRITAEAATSQKRWKASYRGSGAFSIRNADALDRLTSEKLREVLAIVLHRATGPLNLLGRDERVRSVEKVSMNGRQLVRLGVESGKSTVVAYYFDSGSGSLEMVSAGSEAPGGEGTVTLYIYQMLPNGLVFPEKIRVVRTGKNVLVGTSPVMEVEFSDVRVN